MATEAQCGSTWRAWFAKWDHVSCSWRTPQCSFLEDLEQFSETWPRSGLMLRGVCYPLPTLERRTSGNEFGFWPTPVKSDAVARRPTANWDGNSDLPSVVWRRNGGEENPSKPPAKLNPAWVVWLMGWPVGWTSLQPLETDKFHEWQRRHSSGLPKR